MNRVISVMVGPPCSGKSTEADRILKEEPNTLRVNRDSFRYMLRNEGFCNYNIENIITGLMDKAIDKALEGGYDVIIDNTHCKLKYINDITKKYSGKASVVLYTIQCPLWRLRLRNVIRYIKKGVWIPDKVIISMHKNFKNLLKELDNGANFSTESQK